MPMITTKASADSSVTERENRNRLLALEAATEGIVLLENDGTLPLTPCPCALFGAGAEYTIKGGHALADILTGKQTPSGKLAVTWPKSYADVPFGEEFGIPGVSNVVYKEGIYVGYRYYDSFCVAPRYPFGYGKSYSGTFA